MSVRCRVLLSCLLALVACAPAAPAASMARAGPSAPPAPQAAVPHLFDEAFVQQVYAEAVDALDKGAGIQLKTPVPALLLSLDEARARRKAFAHEMPQDAGVTAAMDLAADFVFSDSMLGRYLPDEKVLYLIDEVLASSSHRDRARARDLLFGVMAHELVHAHDDQFYAALPAPSVMLEVVDDGGRLPQLQAQMSLIEGHAVYAAELACRQAGRPLLPAFTLEDARDTRVMETEGRGVAGRLGVGLVNTVARAKLVQYAWGREFCRRAHDFGGEKFLGQVFTSLPLSLAELEDFEVFRQRWAADMEKKMDAEEAKGAP